MTHEDDSATREDDSATREDDSAILYRYRGTVFEENEHYWCIKCNQCLTRKHQVEHGRMFNSQSRGPGFEFLVDTV